MSTFTYQAKDESGKDISGVIEADDARGASSLLREQGLFTMHLAAARNAPAAPVTLSGDAPRLLPGGQYVPVGTQTTIHAAPFLLSVPLPELAIMFRQMGTLFNAGVPMVQSITTLATQSRNGRLKDILTDTAQTVASGHPLSAAFERYPAVFTPIQIELIRAGELGGLLEAMCERIAGYLEREIETRRKLKRETMSAT